MAGPEAGVRALVFGVEPESGNEQESGAGRLTRNLAATPMGLREIDGPSLPGDGRVDLRAILMHTFPLDEWRSAPSPAREAVAP